MEKLQSALEKARNRRAADIDDKTLQAADGTSDDDTGTLTAGDAPGVMTTEPDGHAPGRRDRGGRSVVKRTRSTALVKAEWDRLDARNVVSRHLIRNRIVTLEPRKAAVPFDTLRTKILLEAQRNDWSRIGITSPGTDCDKTTIACNLALSMGRQSDTRTMLFELDTQRPSIADKLGEAPRHSIVELLSGTVSFADQAYRIGDNVAVSAARTAVKDPSRYLLNQDTARILDRIQLEYRPDLMFFDLPPMLVGDDARAFLRNVDAVVIIARAEHSTAQQIDVCEKEVAQYTNVLGVVLSQYRFGKSTDGFESY